MNDMIITITYRRLLVSAAVLHGHGIERSGRIGSGVHVGIVELGGLRFGGRKSIVRRTWFSTSALTSSREKLLRSSSSGILAWAGDRAFKEECSCTFARATA